MPNQASFTAATPGAVVKGTMTDKLPVLPGTPPTGRTAIGPRITPNFINEAWDSGNTYQYYDVVLVEGTSYIARKAVPAGIEITNTEYWIRWSDPNAQFAELQDTVQTFDGRITGNANAIAAEVARATDAEQELSEKVATNTSAITELKNKRDPATPEYYGALGNGTNDDSDAINDCIQANKGKTIYLHPGTIYAISKPINMPFDDADKVCVNGNGAFIKALTDINAFFDVGYDNAGKQYNEAGFKQFYVNDLTMLSDGHEVTYGFKIALGCKDFQINNVVTFRTNIGVQIGANTGSPNDTRIIGCLFFGPGSDIDNSIGIVVNGSDNNVSNTRIYGFKTGVLHNAGCNYEQVQVLLRWKEQRVDNFNPYTINSPEFNAVYDNTVGIVVNDSFAHMLNFYCDSMHTFAKLTANSGKIQMTQCIYFNSRTNTNCTIIECENNVTAPYISLVNNEFYISKNDASYGIHYQTTPAISNYSMLNIADNVFTNKQNLQPYDIILMNTHMRSVMNGTDWIFIGAQFSALSTQRITIDLVILGFMYNVTYDPSENNITQINSASANANYQLAVKRLNETNIVLFFIKGTANAYARIDSSHISNLNVFSPPSYENITAAQMGISSFDKEVTLKQIETTTLS